MKEKEKIKFIFEVKYPKDCFESDINTLLYRFRNFVIFQDRVSKGDSDICLVDHRVNNKNIDNIIEILNKFKIIIEGDDNGRGNN